MIKRRISAVIAVCLISFASAFVTGCEGGRNIPEEQEITVGSLSGEYAAQLVRDGASVIFGSIGLTEGEDGDVWVDIVEKEFVEDANHPNGFYIAYKNLESTYLLSPYAKATFLPGDGSVATAMEAGEFVGAVLSDVGEFGGGDPGYIESKLYDIYIIGETVELLIARYIP